MTRINLLNQKHQIGYYPALRQATIVTLPCSHAEDVIQGLSYLVLTVKSGTTSFYTLKKTKWCELFRRN